MKSLDLFTILHIDLANLHLNLKGILMAKRPHYSSNEGCVPSHGVVYSSAGSWELEGKEMDLANRRGGARGGRGEHSRLVVELAGSIVTWPSRDQLSLGGGGRGQRRRQVGVIGNLTVEEW